MNEREKTIAEYTRKIKEAGNVEIRLRSELGTLLLERDIGMMPGFEDLYVKARETRTALEKNTAAEQDIKRILERRGAIRYRLKEVAGEIESYENENAQSWIPLGEAAYRAYNSGYLSGDEYPSLFAEIIRQIAELRKTEREIEEARSALGSKALFERLIDQGRLAILSGNKSVKERALEREYWKAGKELCASNALDSIEYEPLRELAAACLTNRGKRRDAEELQSSLLGEDEELQAALDSLDAGRYPQKKLQELERLGAGLRESLRGTLVQVGEKYEHEKPAAVVPDPAVETLLNELDAQRRNIRSYELEIERNRAFLRADVLSAQIGEMSRKVGMLEQQIEKSRREIEELKTEIDVRQAEKDRMDQISSGKLTGPIPG